MSADFGSYQDVLKHDGDELPEAMQFAPRINPADPIEVPVAVYIDRRYHELEKEKIWSRVWQVACREEHVPEPGDQYVYDIADQSYLIVRGADRQIRAFVNVCLHRGRMLRDFEGRAPDIRCPFHGAVWNLDGSFRTIPCRNEFAAFSDESWRLPAVAVDTWGGFVFINPGPDPEPLATFLGDLIPQFDRWAIDRRYVGQHTIKKLRCNWKIAQEAFMEAYHVAVTHPQAGLSYGEVLSQYDAFGSFSRAMSPRGVASPLLRTAPSEQVVADSALAQYGARGLAVPEGGTARKVLTEISRKELRARLGDVVDGWTSAEVTDHFYYTVFPSFHPWGTFSTMMYRFRPNGDDHETCLMEHITLPMFEGERPAPAKPRYLDFDDTWTEAVGPNGIVFDQDSLNMPRVQKGLAATRQKTIRLAEGQENKLRHFYGLYQKWIGEDWSAS